MLKNAGSSLDHWLARYRCDFKAFLKGVVMSRLHRSLASVLLIGLALTGVTDSIAIAREDTEKSVIPTSGENPDDLGFLNGHPDLRWRTEGVRAYEKKRYSEAFTYFRRGARYADKASQAMVAEMLWRGEGVDPDRTLAYIWMDLAAERAYRPFLLAREQYWGELSDQEKQRVATLGPAIFDEHEDRVAKPRLERIMERARRNVTGSHLGTVGTLSIQVRGPAGMISIPADQYYRSKYWKADEYWEWQDEVWKAPLKGEVRVGPLIQGSEQPER